MSGGKLELDEKVEQYISNLRWVTATENEKTIVICNIRGFYGWLKEQLGLKVID